MEEILKQLLKYVVDFDDRTLEIVSHQLKPQFLRKNSVLLSQGEVCNDFYFVTEGCIRTCFISKEGDEKTRYIMLSPSMRTALTSFITQQPSFEFLDVVEDTKLYSICYADFYRLNKEQPLWAQFYQKILEMAYTFQNKKIESLVTLSAKQRYEQLLMVNPRIIQTLSNKVVASYLDVAQETLSRLKSK